jgi:homoserine O-acetyltransferase/O-succinyltransferase
MALGAGARRCYIGDMRRWIVWLLATTAAGAQSPDVGVRRFSVDTFRFEGGVTVPHITMAYATFGRRNAARDNAIVAPSHWMIDHHGYDAFLSRGHALDTTRYFVVTTEMLGNGVSSSPSNTPEPFHGPRFPAITIRDNVRLAHALLVDSLRLTHVRAIVGFAMGAQQAFQWAVSYPDFADRIVVTAGTAKCYPHGVVMVRSLIAALQSDSAHGVRTLGAVWAPWLFSPDWWRDELWRADTARGRSFDDVLSRIIAAFQIYDANDMLSQFQMWASHDIGTSPGYGGDTERALRAIRVPVLSMPSETDLYFPLADARYESRFIRRVTLTPIPSRWGHPAGAGTTTPADLDFLDRAISRFISAYRTPPRS